ncbi:MAG: ParB/RepB/Spo0J family partition protein [Armatimonadota bacterium]
MFKKGLGRGLDALIPGGLAAETHPIVEVSPGEIDPNPYQPRMGVSEESVAELAESIRRHGMIQPLLVRRKEDRYELVAGERRWRAAQVANVQAVPCIVRDVSDDRALQLALVENLQREDLTPIEAARGYERLIGEFSLTQSELAEQVGRSRVAITNALRLLTLPAEIQDSVQGGETSEGHARALLGIQDEGELRETWRQVVERNLSVRETERLVQAKSALHLAQEARRSRPAAATDTADLHLTEAIERLQTALSARVEIKRRPSGGGTIVVRYHDPEELARLVDAMAGVEQWSS